MPTLDRNSLVATAELTHERIQQNHQGSGTVPDNAEVYLTDEIVNDFRTQFNLGSESLQSYAAFKTWPEKEPYPMWLRSFTDIYQAINPSTAVEVRVNALGEEQPFIDILGRIVTHATSRLTTPSHSMFTDEATDQFASDLLERLTDLCAKAVHVDYLSFVAERGADEDRIQELSPDSTEWHDRYVEAFLRNRKATFFNRYPVLARQITIVINQWVKATSEFCTRIENDIGDIASLLSTENLNTISEIQFLGDPHDGGRRVTLIRFSSGKKVIYKPRNLGPEQALYSFQRWLSSTFEDFPCLPSPSVHSEQSHGWVQEVSAGEFSNDTELITYYSRAGALLFLQYLLATTDCHERNIIATNSGPVLIDAETVLDIYSPDLPDHQPDAIAAFTEFQNSVLYSQLLPILLDRSGNEWSGFSVGEGRNSVSEPNWEHVNTDAVDAEYVHQSTGSDQNVPKRNGRFVVLNGFLQHFLAGFRRAYDVALEHKHLIGDRIWELFGSLQTRRILRDTSIYSAAISTLSNPKFLRNGFNFGCKLYQVLSKRDRRSQSRNLTRSDAVIEVELDSVFRRDIPRFTANSSDTDIYHDSDMGEPVRSGVKPTGLKTVLERLNSLSKADQRRQIALIQATIAGTDYTTCDPHGAQYE